MDENTARQVLLVRAFETAAADHPLWNTDDRRWATRVALEGADPQAAPVNASRFLAVRAEAAIKRLGPRAPSMTAWLSQRLWHTRWAFAALLLGGVLGFAADAVGPSHRINLLAPSVWGLLAWNALVYVLLLLPLSHRRLREALARRTLSLRSLTRSSRADRKPPADAPGAPSLASILDTFVQHWLRLSAPLSGARAAVLLHLGSAGLALGLIGGLYLRGLVLDYRAGWASTFLDGAQVHQWLWVALGPAMQLTGLTLPDSAGFEALRVVGDVPPPPAATNGAATWIHLYAVTLLLFVVGPRLVLAGLGGLRALWLSRRFPLPLKDDAYFEDLLRQQRREQARVTLLPYAQAPDHAAADALREWLRPVLGETLQWQVAPVRAYGSEEDAAVPLVQASRPTLLLPLFDLSATPEAEIHGRWLTQLQAAMAAQGGPRCLVAVEESGFLQRFGTAPERITQRREAWRALVAGLGLTVLPLNQGVPVEPAAGLARQWLAGMSPQARTTP